MDRVKINGKLDGCFYSSNIKINNLDLKSVKSIDLHIDEENFIPKINICAYGIPDIDVMGRVVIDPSPINLQESCRIIVHELQKHGEFYDAFVASVLSAIREIPDEIWSVELAERIVKRISGEE